MAPANLRDPRVASALLHFATRYAERETVTLDMHAPMTAPKSSDGLMEMEATHQVWTAARTLAFAACVHQQLPLSGVSGLLEMRYRHQVQLQKAERLNLHVWSHKCMQKGGKHAPGCVVTQVLWGEGGIRKRAALRACVLHMCAHASGNLQQ